MQGQRFLKFATLGAVESVRCKVLGTVLLACLPGPLPGRSNSEMLLCYWGSMLRSACQRLPPQSCDVGGTERRSIYISVYLSIMELCVQVRQLSNSAGETEEAGPSIAVQMIGLNAVPVAGDEFVVCETEQEVPLRPSQQLPYTDSGIHSVLRCHV